VSASVHVMTGHSLWTRLKATGFATSFTTGGLTGQRGAPSGDGVVEIGDGKAQLVPNSLIFKFFGVGINNNAGSVRIWGWEGAVGNDGANSGGSAIWYEPTLLAELALTLGQRAGVAGGLIGTSDLEVDTIAVTVGNDDVDLSIISSTDVRGMYARVDLQGNRIWQLEVDKGTATSLNCLYRYGR
jgi:hypothetical protein